MTLDDLLKKALQEMGGPCMGLIMGFDGILVTESKTQDFKLESSGELGIEISQWMKQFLNIAQNESLGGFEEMDLQTDKYSLLFRIINHEYFLGLVMNKDLNLGKGKYLIKKIAPQLSKVL